ncbi:MAG TPA: spore coat U domain-containing protein [Burkholderiaceae bacterium]
MPLTRLLRAALLACGLFACGAAHALCTLVCSCNVSTTSVAFGSYNPLSAGHVTSTGNVRVSCGGAAGLAIPVTLTLSAGTSGSMAARQMASGPRRLNYNVYVNTAYFNVWGDGSGATLTQGAWITLNLLGLAPPLDFTVYGRIPGGQSSVAPGAYTDTLVVTLTYF